MPSKITPIKYFYTYVLLSLLDNEHYVGSTTDLRKRLKEHKTGLVRSTKSRQPMKLIYYEACINEEDARQRERYFKTTIGRRWLGMRLRRFNQSV